MHQNDDQLAQSIESLIRTIPERWHDFDHDDLTATEQQALFLLVADGLVERRFGLRLEMAGRGEAIEAKLAATGEYGMVEALDPVGSKNSAEVILGEFTGKSVSLKHNLRTRMSLDCQT